jgi:hypothetical protein
MADLKEVSLKTDNNTYPVCVVCRQNIQTKFEFLACGGSTALNCNACLQKIKKCHLCHVDILGHIISGFAKKLLLDNLVNKTFICPNKLCNEKLSFDKYQKHLDTCEFTRLDCKYLGCTGYFAKDINHLEMCKNVVSSCIYGCKMTIKRCDMESHFDTCSEVYTMCQNMNCFAQFKNGDAKEHKCGFTNQKIELDNKYVTIKHGVTIDCIDSCDIWCEGRIMKIEEKRFLIKFTNFPTECNDEWFDIYNDKFTVHRTVTQWDLYKGRKIVVNINNIGHYFHIKNINFEDDDIRIVRTLDNKEFKMKEMDITFMSVYLQVPNITTGMICQVFHLGNKWITAKINNINANKITYTIINKASDLSLIRNDGSLNYIDVCCDPNMYFKLVGCRLAYEEDMSSSDEEDNN